jgi:hypothetical protein
MRVRYSQEMRGSSRQAKEDHHRTFPGAACCRPTELTAYKAAPLHGARFTSHLSLLTSVHHVNRRFPGQIVRDRTNRTGPELLTCFL